MKRSRIKKAVGRYLKIVEWSDEDKCFVGRVPGLFAGGIHGTDEVTVYRELCVATAEWLQVDARRSKGRAGRAQRS